MNEELRILLIEDNPGDARLIQEMLAESGVKPNITWCERLADIPKGISENSIDVILLDLALPDSFGIESFTRVQENVPEIPVIILTNTDDENLAILSVHHGAQDYLVKGQIDGDLLRHAIRYAIERKHTEEALRHSKEKYCTLVENINTIIWQSDIQGNITFINKNGQEALEISEEMVIGKNSLSLLHPDDRNEALEAIQKMMVSGENVTNHQCRLIAKQGKGREFPIIQNVSLLRNSKNEIIGVQGIARDITELKKAEKKIQNQNRQLSIINQIIRLANSSLILDEMLEIVLKITIELLDFDKGWVYLKDADGTRAELIAYHGVPSSFVEKNHYLKIRDYPFNVVFFAGQPRIIDNLPENPPGQFDTKILEDVDAICYAGVPLIADSVVVGALYVSKQTQYTFSNRETAILESIGKEVGGTILRGMLQDQLEEAYEEVNCYLDIMVHDIKDATSELIRQTNIINEMLDGPATRFTEKQFTAVQQISEIINNVNTIRRINEEQPECGPVNLDFVIRAEMTKFPSAKIHYDTCGISVLADDLLSEVFANLLGNSVKYGGPGVEIWITVAEEDNEVSISVEDNGPGILGKNRMKIFSSFQPNSRKPSGRGLGLHISKLLINRYSGTIRADDRVVGKPTMGLAIRFTLPGYEEEEI